VLTVLIAFASVTHEDSPPHMGQMSVIEFTYMYAHVYMGMSV